MYMLVDLLLHVGRPVVALKCKTIPDWRTENKVRKRTFLHRTCFRTDTDGRAART
jgi:hypothetical protein